MVCVRACGRAHGTRVMHVCRCARVSLERWGYKVRGNPGGWQVRCLQLGREAGGPERAGRPLGWRLRAPRGECPPPPRGCCHPPTGRGPHHARAPASYPGLGEGSGQTHRLGVTGPRLRTDTRGGGGGMTRKDALTLERVSAVARGRHSMRYMQKAALEPAEQRVPEAGKGASSLRPKAHQSPGC